MLFRSVVVASGLDGAHLALGQHDSGIILGGLVVQLVDPWDHHVLIDDIGRGFGQELPDISGLSQDELRERIYEERKFEFAYEIDRLFDCFRSGNLEKWVLADRDVPVERFHNLLPIPQEAIDLDPNLYQNAGY